MANKKLRILCLYGYSNSAESFRHMAGQFFELCNPHAEFFIPEAPFLSKELRPKFLKEMNMNDPLRSWFDLKDWVYDETLLPPKLLYRLEHTIDHLINYMNANGPFDGFLTFS